MSRSTKAAARRSLESLTFSARELASDLSKDDDWMSRVNADSLFALTELARGTSSSRAYGSLDRVDAEEFRAPLLAAVGAADVALQRVTDIVAALGQFLDEALTDVGTRFDVGLAQIAKLPDAISPPRISAIVQAAYDDLILRGEATLERIGASDEEKPAREETVGRKSSDREATFSVEVRKLTAHTNAIAHEKGGRKTSAKKAAAKKVAARRVGKVAAARRVRHK
jgi:heparin binding hemagglutinin HbhA